VRWWGLLALVGCGRVGFALHDDAGGVGGDIASDVAPDSGPRPALGCGYAEVILGAYHGCGMDPDGSLSCWGDGQFGELGDGSFNAHYTPMPAQGTWIALARSEDSTQCGIAPDRTVWCWGQNEHAVLGPGGDSAVAIQMQYQGAPLDRAIKVAVGEDSACVVRDDKTVYCWGWNLYGQTGSAVAAPDVSAPQPISGILPDEITAGYGHVCMRVGDQVRCFGWNLYGQLADGTTTTHETITTVLEGAAPLTGVVQITSGYLQSCALLTDATVKCWGTGRALGNLANGGGLSPSAIQAETAAGVPLTNVTYVGTGDRHTCALRSDTSVWCWGDNPAGQLGDTLMADRTQAAPVLLQSGLPLTGVLQLVVSNSVNCAVRANDVLCWGANGDGQMATGGTGLGQYFAGPALCPP